MANPNLPVRVEQTAGVIAAEGETASSAVAAREKAAVEARFLVALHRPRNPDTARVRILNACKRPRFAEGAKYAKPVGGSKVVGPSIRFVEEALRQWGNIDIQTPVVFDDDERRIVRVSVTDLETNTSFSSDVTLTKTVERRNPKNGDEIVRQRTNSTGQTVYIVRADEDAFLNKQNAGISKAIRNNGLRVVPSDVVEEAMDEVEETLHNEDAKDPSATRKRLTDAFYALGVMPEHIAALLGHALESMTPAELTLLRTIYTALKDNETTWAEALATFGKGEAPANGGTTKPKAATKGNDGLKAALAKKKDETPAPVSEDESDAALQAEAQRLAEQDGAA